MKRLKYIAFTVLLASFSLQSCDLERYPLTDLSEDNFWTDDKNAELALTSLYRGSITNGLEYSVSDFWSYHGMLFMEHLTDNAYDRRGENNPFFNISSGKLIITLLLKTIGHRLISVSVCVTVSWRVLPMLPNQNRKPEWLPKPAFCVPLSITIWPVILRMYL